MEFYSSGKLLITGEYLVMNGAVALAVPVNFGQTLQVTDIFNPGILKWESRAHNKPWFSAEINTGFFDIVETNDRAVADKLIDILHGARKMNTNFLIGQQGWKVISNANFDLNWGLGSSSSLISNIAYWADVDPFDLNKKVAKGSGYDVICARQDGPVFFQQKSNGYITGPAEFNSVFKDAVYFVYLGRKQDTSESVSWFLQHQQSYRKEIEIISEITRNIVSAETIQELENLISEHENLMSQILKKERLKETRFPDFKGEVKSLGAWGGDFAMLTWEGTKQELVNYLVNKQIDVVFNFNELIKSR